MSRRSRRSNRYASKKKTMPIIIFSLLLVLFAALTVFLLFFNKVKEETTPSQETIQTETSLSHSTSNTEVKTVDNEVRWEKQETPVSIPILMYHAIHDMAPEESANANLIVAPTVFESHLQALQEAGYYTLTPEEAYKVLTENVLPAGKKVVWLTFDDSLWDFYQVAFPILQKYNMKATNNVITGLTATNQAGHLSIEQIKEMSKAGMSFQGHTVNHPDLEYSDLESQRMELEDSKAYLDRELAQNTLAVAYPAGRYSSETIQIVENSGYKLGLTTNEGLASISDGLLTLNRVRILPVTDPEGLLEIISQ